MSHYTTRAMKAAAAATPGVGNNATTKDPASKPATNTKPPTTKKRRKATHTAVAVPDLRAPKRARNGYELFLLAGGVDLLTVRVFIICFMPRGYAQTSHFMRTYNTLHGLKNTICSLLFTRYTM